MITRHVSKWHVEKECIIWDLAINVIMAAFHKPSQRGFRLELVKIEVCMKSGHKSPVSIMFSAVLFLLLK